MKKVSLTGIFLLIASVMVSSKQIELESITNGTFRSQSMAEVNMLSDGETFAQLSSDHRQIVRYSLKTGKEMAVLFDLSHVKDAQFKRIDGYTISPDGLRILIQTNTRKIYRRSFTATYYIYRVDKKSIEPLSTHGAQQTPVFSPDGKQIAFVRDNNIFMVRLSDHTEVQITADGKRNQLINGIPDWVNEEEFGFNCAMVFTSDSRHLVWIRYDEKEVKEFAIPMFKGMKPAHKEFTDYPGTYAYKYPIAGEQNSKVGLWSYDTLTGQTNQLPVPLDVDGYIPRVVMTGNAPHVAVYTLNRHQNCLRIYMVNPHTKACEQIIEEKSDRYIREEVLSGIRFTDGHILLPSDRDGYMHLYLYDLKGRMIRQIESGDYEVSRIYGYDERTGNTYFASHENGATDQRIWVARKNGKRHCLTPQAGWNAATFSSDYRYFIRVWSNINTPTVYSICDKDGKLLHTMIDNSELQKKLSEYQFGKRELFSFTTESGVRLNGWMIKPANFDAGKRYPVVMYQYGGPGSQQVRDAWDIGQAGQGGLLEQYLCQEGFICVCVDNRGTGGRGAAFEKCTYLKLGQLEAYDQVETALWLAKQSYVDKDRIGIWGWSFGGFNTLMSMSEGRPVFRAGIAIAPPTSWRYYDTVYTERFMRTPQENPTGYDDCPISRADKLHGALLLCHGIADDNVHFRNMAEYTEALVQADKDFRQLAYTNRSHSISGGNTRNHLYRQCINFFIEQLKNK